MRYFSLYGILIIIAVILQSLSIFPEIFSGIHPDFLLIISVMVAINYGRTVGGGLGFIAGLLQELFSGGLFGVHSISKTITGYLCGFLKEHLYQNHFLVPPLITLLATITDQLLILFFTNVFTEILVLKHIVKTVIIPLAIWNSIISLFLYPLIYKLESLITRRKFW